MSRPPRERRAAGSRAESAVCAWLEGRGMEIVARNVRARGGELDIVAREGEVLVFVEVRYREDDQAGLPEESVTLPKRRRIVAAAKAFLSTVPASSWKEARFDVAAVEGDPDAPVIRHHPGAFDARGKIL